MTNKANAALLFAALVVSSGVCLSEAFSRSGPVSARSSTPSSSIARFYAPKDSLESNGPKRRRGRPRKNESIAPTIARKKKTTRRQAASSSVSESDAVKRRSSREASTKKASAVSAAARKKKASSRSNPVSNDVIMSSLLDHELLTKEEELILGMKIRKASELQEAIAVWMEDNRERLQQQQEYQRIESVYGSQLDGDYLFSAQEDDDMNNPLFGSASSQAVERYYSEEGAEEDLFYQDGTPFEMEDMSYTVFKPEPQNIVPSVPETWMDDILSKDDDSVLAMSSVLSDHDIRQVLQLKGGRSELRSILLEGALAREQLIRRNIKLVLSIAKKWVGEPRSSKRDSLVRAYGGGSGFVTGRPTLDEALQEGVLGLAEAAERYDPDRGFRFSTYATMWVTNSIRKCFQLESTSGLRLPIPYYDMKTKYVAAVQKYVSTTGEIPSMEVLADELEISVKRLSTILRFTQPLVSLDASRGGSSQGANGAGKSGSAGEDDGEYSLASVIPCDEPRPEDICERSLLRQCLENAMATELSPNERDIVRLRLGLDDGVPQTAKEVAEIFGGHFSQSAIRGMEQKALNKLRSPFGVHTQQLMAYLDFAGIDGSSIRR